ncbi:OmpA family protein [Veronia pacifica]|uniref:OmpA-like domain-containing protein n=1 Tax=Veronia pacifica TaxID=1080227 RepID=A0A1C3ES89_9GAMM|nr:OmpA family protein [Veronia pacifica]ODA36073.1 hypothetical protein A8L45_00255 [Veronia pacifica]
MSRLLFGLASTMVLISSPALASDNWQFCHKLTHSVEHHVEVKRVKIGFHQGGRYQVSDILVADTVEAKIALGEFSKFQSSQCHHMINGVEGLGKVLFAFDRAELSLPAKQTLDHWSKKMAGKSWQVEGHTDNMGSARYNQKLGGKRAASAAGYLSKKSLAGEISESSLGEQQPDASNKTRAGRQLNRRVVLSVGV